MKMIKTVKKNGEQIAKLDEYKELVIECGYSGTLTYYGEDKAVIRVYRNGVDYKNIYEREKSEYND